MVQRWAEGQFGDMETAAPIRLRSGDKLLILRRLDHHPVWESLDDQRQCRRCGSVFNGRQVDVVGGTRERGPLRLLCPSEGCSSAPGDWICPGRRTSPSAGVESKPTLPRLGFTLRRQVHRPKQVKKGLSPLNFKPQLHAGLAQKIARLLHPERTAR